MPDFYLRRAFGVMISIALLLGGCSINGSYPDASEPDAAKLRFISGLENATLDVFDSSHCDGRTTGLLNNLFTTNTRRRADMSIAPPTDAKAYLEIRLKPGSELFLHLNTLGTGVVCSNAFNFTPQSGAEYELTFDYVGNQCRTSLRSLHQVDGKVSRAAMPLLEKGLPACAGSNRLFAKGAEAQPDTPERTAMFEQIIASSLTGEMKVKTVPVEKAVARRKIDTLLDERKKQMGFMLPDAYWDEYRRNMDLLASDAASSKERAVQLYEEQYRTYLRKLDTTEIRKLLPDGDSTDLSLAMSVNNKMLQNYYTAVDRVRREGLSNHFARMADLDKRYAVCARYADCWKN